MKKILLTLAAMSLSATMAYANGEGGNMKEACASDVTTSGCTGEGHDLKKCVRDYKKSHHDFKISDSCKSAMKQKHEARKEKREERKNKQAAKKDEKKDTK